MGSSKFEYKTLEELSKDDEGNIVTTLQLLGIDLDNYAKRFKGKMPSTVDAVHFSENDKVLYLIEFKNRNLNIYEQKNNFKSCGVCNNFQEVKNQELILLGQKLKDTLYICKTTQEIADYNYEKIKFILVGSEMKTRNPRQRNRKLLKIVNNNVFSTIGKLYLKKEDIIICTKLEDII